MAEVGHHHLGSSKISGTVDLELGAILSNEQSKVVVEVTTNTGSQLGQDLVEDAVEFGRPQWSDDSAQLWEVPVAGARLDETVRVEQQAVARFKGELDRFRI